jgi:hypothetical protein
VRAVRRRALRWGGAARTCCRAALALSLSGRAAALNDISAYEVPVDRRRLLPAAGRDALDHAASPTRGDDDGGRWRGGDMHSTVMSLMCMLPDASTWGGVELPLPSAAGGSRAGLCRDDSKGGDDEDGGGVSGGPDDDGWSPGLTEGDAEGSSCAALCCGPAPSVQPLLGASTSIGCASCSGLSGDSSDEGGARLREECSLRCCCAWGAAGDAEGECVTRACRRENAAGSTSASNLLRLQRRVSITPTSPSTSPARCRSQSNQPQLSHNAHHHHHRNSRSHLSANVLCTRCSALSHSPTLHALAPADADLLPPEAARERVEREGVEGARSLGVGEGLECAAADGRGAAAADEEPDIEAPWICG